MHSLGERLLARWSGLKILAASLLFGAAGFLPLLLYIQFGPSDGNPIGLGLLAMAAIPVTAVGVLVGLVKSLVDWLSRNRA